jgi:phosphatidylglycerophosphatase A
MTFWRIATTFFGAGLLRPAPGTWGTLAALPVAWALHVTGGFALLAFATLAITLGGWWSVLQHTRGLPDPDLSEIVIDEVAGMWLALWPVSLGAQMMGAPVTALWPGWVVAFLAFRAFDILKPGPVGWADRRKDALGVMLDDLIAGALAAVVVVALAAIAHGVLM